MVRYMDRHMCEGRKGKRIRVCYPGAGVADVEERLDRVVRGSGENTTVLIHVGSNDVSKFHSEELLNRYKKLVLTLRNTRRKGILTGILPCIWRREEWSSRALGINQRVRALCKANDVLFVDLWDDFYGKDVLYRQDGRHLSKQGDIIFARMLEKILRGAGN